MPVGEGRGERKWIEVTHVIRAKNKRRVGQVVPPRDAKPKNATHYCSHQRFPNKAQHRDVKTIWLKPHLLTDKTFSRAFALLTSLWPQSLRGGGRAM